MSIPIPHPPEPGNTSEFHKIIAVSYDDNELDKVRVMGRYYAHEAEEGEQKLLEPGKPYDQEEDPANICARQVGAYILLKEFGRSNEEAMEQAQFQLEALGFEVIYTLIDEGEHE